MQAQKYMVGQRLWSPVWEEFGIVRSIVWSETQQGWWYRMRTEDGKGSWGSTEENLLTEEEYERSNSCS